MGQSNCQRNHKLHIKKDAFKFSAAHMTVFPDGTKESLHGHNYTIEVTVHLKEISFKKMISFSEIKSAMRIICEEWDEKVLIALKNPYFEIRSESSVEIDFLLCKKRYVLPKDEVAFLPIDNITSEALAEEFASRLGNALKIRIQSQEIIGLQVRIEESFGQGSTFEQYEFK